VTDRVRPLALGMPVTAVHFLGDKACFVGAEESVAMASADGEISPVAVHSGGILCAASMARASSMGGDDGKVVALMQGRGELLATDAKRRWIDNVALHPDGAVAWCRQDGFCPQRQGRRKIFEAPSTVGGLAFAPKRACAWRSHIITA